MAGRTPPTRQLAFDFPHRPAQGRKDFLVSSCNSEAIRWIDSWPDWPGPALIVYGPAGCGKTHLAHVWRHRTQASDLTAMDINRIPPFDLLEEHRACVVDGIAGDVDETALFHLYNAAGQISAHMLITDRKPPVRWNVALPDLSSRLAAAPAVEITAPDDALLSAVFVKIFRDKGVDVSPAVIDYLLVRIERSFEAIQKMASKLDRAAMSRKSRITIPLARAVIEETRVNAATLPPDIPA